MKKTLYKTDSKNNTRFLELKVNGAVFSYSLGIVGTDNPITHEKVCEGKNIGKKNETTPEQQAMSEMLSKFTRKQSEGYFETIEEAQNTVVILPMLAKSYDKEKHKINWKTTFCQPKYDGMRCLAHIKNGKVTLYSRKGKLIETLPHIVESFSRIKYDCSLDGELYIHGASFQENMKAIKKYRKGITEQVQFRVYDIVSDDSYPDRMVDIAKFTQGINNVKITPTYRIKNEEELKEYHKKFLQEGYEGTMVRWSNDGYKIKGRSSSLLKYKDFQDIALPIIDIIPADTKPTWGVPVFELNGKRFKTGTRLSHVEREDLLTNKNNYIGKTGEIRFFEYTDDGSIRFGVLVGIRLDK